MALPTILLREFRTTTISDWIPGKLAQTYDQLEALAFSILSKSSTGWHVHFHFEDGVCEGKALRLLWDNGAYFDDDALKGGKLHLYAHFVRKDTSIPASQTWSTAPSSITATNMSPYSVTQSIPRTALENVDLALTSPRYTSVHTMRSMVLSSQKRKRANIHSLSDSDSEGSDETQFILSASDCEEDIDEEAEDEEDSQLDSNEIQRQLDSDTKAAHLRL